MQIIKEIVCDIIDEVHGAKHYAKLANKYKQSNREIADMYAKLASVELDHVNILHNSAEKIIKEYTSTWKEAPPAMMAVWDYEHGRQIEKVEKAKRLLEMYREG